jgi:hypothetical protein
MKKILSFLLIYFIASNSFAQTSTITGNSFITTIDNLVVYGVKSDGKVDKTKTFKIPKGTKFNANGFDEDNNVKITFWDYSVKTKPAKSSLAIGYSFDYSSGKEYIGSWANEKDFIIDLKVFNLGAKPYYGKRNDFTWGVMTLPIKARLGDKKEKFFDVEENLNLGFTFGLRHQIQSKKEQALNYLVGISIARVRTDSISLKNNFTAPQSSIAPALMISGGILYQYETFQVGIFLGVDNVMGELGRNWKFQGKPWLGFAIGVSLFSRNGTQSGTGSNSDK